MNVGGSSMRVILIKYGELSTKKGNRNFFINTLYNNVKSKLGMYDVSINKDRAKMTIKFRDEDFDDICEDLLKLSSARIDDFIISLFVFYRSSRGLLMKQSLWYLCAAKLLFLRTTLKCSTSLSQRQ